MKKWILFTESIEYPFSIWLKFINVKVNNDVKNSVFAMLTIIHFILIAKKFTFIHKKLVEIAIMQRYNSKARYIIQFNTVIQIKNQNKKGKCI